MSEYKRAQIFKIYSTNLIMLIEHGLIPDVRKKYDNPYICPICLDEFDESHLDVSKTEHLTLEDAPPKSLGGKANILTCKKCNNTCGSQIDSHLANRILELDKTKFFWNSEAKTKTEKDGLTVNGTMFIDDKGEMKMHHTYKNNNPKVLDEYMNKIKADSIITIFFMPTRVDDNRLKIALLKTAYLLMFEKYGYSLIFNKEYERIRQQLLKPEEIIYPLDFWFLGPFPEELTKIVPFCKEKGLACIMPFFKLSTNRSHYIFAGILPVNARPTEEIISGFKEKFNQTSEFSVTMQRFDSTINFLANPEKIKDLIAFTKTLK